MAPSASSTSWSHLGYARFLGATLRFSYRWTRFVSRRDFRRSLEYVRQLSEEVVDAMAEVDLLSTGAVKAAADGVTERVWDAEERAARVVATAVEVLGHCAAEPAGTPPSFRVFANTRRKALRAAIRHRSERLVVVDDISRFEGAAGIGPPVPDEEQHLEELVEWVRERGHLRE